MLAVQIISLWISIYYMIEYIWGMNTEATFNKLAQIAFTTALSVFISVTFLI